MKLWNRIKQALLQNPSQTLCERNAAMTYKELAAFAERYAKRLKGERCCAILCRSEMAAAMGLLSCFAAGVTAVPLSLRYGEAHCRKILDFISPSCLVTDTYGELMATYFGEAKYIRPKAHPALIMCTSGTTGTPKGVMLSEENLLANVQAIAAYFNIGKTDTVLIARPLYHCAVLTGELLTGLVKGSRIVFYSQAFQPAEILKQLRENKITVFCATPTLLDMLARFLRKTDPIRTLRHIAVSGECLSDAVGKRIASAFPDAALYHVYGLTEASPRVSFLPPPLFREFPSFVGKPLDGVSVKLCTSDGSPVEAGETGILWVRGGNVMLGYYNDPAQTEKVLQNGWLCTGDLAERNEEGLLRVKGRSDDLIIRAGMNIYPQEIESALKEDPRVREVMAYGMPHPLLGTQIGMKISGAFSSVEEVKALCGKILPPYQIPARIELTDRLPKNGSGKLIRRKAHDGV